MSAKWGVQFCAVFDSNLSATNGFQLISEAKASTGGCTWLWYEGLALGLQCTVQEPLHVKPERRMFLITAAAAKELPLAKQLADADALFEVKGKVVQLVLKLDADKATLGLNSMEGEVLQVVDTNGRTLAEGKVPTFNSNSDTAFALDTTVDMAA